MTTNITPEMIAAWRTLRGATIRIPGYVTPPGSENNNRKIDKERWTSRGFSPASPS